MSWQKSLANGFASSSELLAYLNLPTDIVSQSAHEQFKTRVPRGFAELMESGNPVDPLLMQVLATHAEMIHYDEFVPDPLAERAYNAKSGLLHKYHGRVLLTVVGACAINCRYCFRRHFPYHENNPGRAGWDKVFSHISEDNTINEVILSGGDPLLANNDLLAFIIDGIRQIPHITTLRFHTRIPIVLPERIDKGLVMLLKHCDLNKVVVVHSNHPNELDHRAAIALKGLRGTGCHLLNQSVLLKGVNDCANTLAELSRQLFSCGALPYYLHVLDKVAGAGHFDIQLAEAKQIFKQLQALLPGYLVPRLAQEIAGQPNKTLII